MEIAQIILMLAIVFILSKTLSRVVAKFGVPGLIGEIILGGVLANLGIGDFNIAEALNLAFLPGLTAEEIRSLTQ